MLEGLKKQLRGSTPSQPPAIQTCIYYFWACDSDQLTVVVGEHDLVVSVQSACHVVRIEHGKLRGLAQSGLSHHLDVSPRDRQNQR